MSEPIYYKPGGSGKCTLNKCENTETKEDGSKVYECDQEYVCEEGKGCEFQKVDQRVQVTLTPNGDGTVSVSEFDSLLKMKTGKGTVKEGSNFIVAKGTGLFGASESYKKYLMTNYNVCRDGEVPYGRIPDPPKGASSQIPSAMVKAGETDIPIVTAKPSEMGKVATLAIGKWAENNEEDKGKDAGAVVIYYPKGKQKDADALVKKYEEKGIVARSYEVEDELYDLSKDGMALNKKATDERKKTLTVAFIPAKVVEEAKKDNAYSSPERAEGESDAEWKKRDKAAREEWSDSIIADSLKEKPKLIYATYLQAGGYFSGKMEEINGEELEGMTID